jgi:hypothetical protein
MSKPYLGVTLAVGNQWSMAKRWEIEDCFMSRDRSLRDKSIVPVGFHYLTTLAKYFDKIVSFPAQACLLSID